MSADTYPDGMAIDARRALHQLRALLPLIGRVDLVDRLRLDQYGGPGEWMIDIADTGIAIDTAHRFAPPHQLIRRYVDGLRVLTWRSSAGSRWTPPDTWDHTEFESRSIAAVLRKVADLLAQDAINRLPALPPDLAYAQTVDHPTEDL